MVSLFLKYLRLHYFANQALLLIVYRFYGCPVNYFITVQILAIPTQVDQIFGAT